MKDLYVVAFGNVFDGVTLFGPFADYEGAMEWAAYHTDGQEWFVRRLESIEDQAHIPGCICADCSGAELTAEND